MILQIRTKDNLDDLLRHGTSPSWVISEGKIKSIEKVEIFQFDGKKVLKADFKADLSRRTESGRLIVAFSNGTIEECEHKWIGQNPIKYIRDNEAILENITNTTSTMESNQIKVGFYAGRNNDDDNNEECCNLGDQPDYILLGGFKENNGKKEFVGRVITNWCDKYPTDSLIYNGKTVIDSAGIAEDEDGTDLWETASNEFPNLLSEITSLYDYLEIDEDEEHYNLSSEIPDELRLYNLYEGNFVNLQEVKKGNGENLGIDFWL